MAVAENSADKQNAGQAEQDDRAGQTQPVAGDNSNSVEPTSLESELAAANDRVLRAQAELDNYRKRVRREMDEHQRYAEIELLRDLLPVVDDIDRAIEAAEKTDEAASLLKGIRIVRTHLQEVLQQHGCRQVEAEGVPFDPAVHHAILQQPSEEHPSGHVMHVAKQGYLLHDRVVRPAQVIVAQGKEG